MPAETIDLGYWSNADDKILLMPLGILETALGLRDSCDLHAAIFQLGREASRCLKTLSIPVQWCEYEGLALCTLPLVHDRVSRGMILNPLASPIRTPAKYDSFPGSQPRWHLFLDRSARGMQPYTPHPECCSMLLRVAGLRVGRSIYYG